MRLRREEIYGVDIAVRRPTLLNLFNVWDQSGSCVRVPDMDYEIDMAYV